MTSRDPAVVEVTGYVRVGQQRNRGFISDKSTSALVATQPPVQRVPGCFSRFQSGGA